MIASGLPGPGNYLTVFAGGLRIERERSLHRGDIVHAAGNPE